MGCARSKPTTHSLALTPAAPAFFTQNYLPKPVKTSLMLGCTSTSSTSGLICGPVKDETGGTWGVLVVAEPLGGAAFNEDSLNVFRSVAIL